MKVRFLRRTHIHIFRDMMQSHFLWGKTRKAQRDQAQQRTPNPKTVPKPMVLVSTMGLMNIW